MLHIIIKCPSVTDLNWRVKRAQNRERGPPSAPDEILSLSFFLLGLLLDGVVTSQAHSGLADTFMHAVGRVEVKNLT